MLDFPYPLGSLIRSLKSVKSLRKSSRADVFRSREVFEQGSIAVAAKAGGNRRDESVAAFVAGLGSWCVKTEA